MRTLSPTDNNEYAPLWNQLNFTHFVLLYRHRHWSHWSFLGGQPEDDSFSYLSTNCGPKFSDLDRLYIQWCPCKSVVSWSAAALTEKTKQHLHVRDAHPRRWAWLSCSVETLSARPLKQKRPLEGLWQQHASYIWASTKGNFSQAGPPLTRLNLFLLCDNFIS